MHWLLVAVYLTVAVELDIVFHPFLVKYLTFLLSCYWLQSENLMLAEKHKIEKEQNNQLRDQISHLLKVEQDQKLKMQERDLTIQSLQVKC